MLRNVCLVDLPTSKELYSNSLKGKEAKKALLYSKHPKEIQHLNFFYPEPLTEYLSSSSPLGSPSCKFQIQKFAFKCFIPNHFPQVLHYYYTIFDKSTFTIHIHIKYLTSWSQQSSFHMSFQNLILLSSPTNIPELSSSDFRIMVDSFLKFSIFFNTFVKGELWRAILPPTEI